MTDTRADRIANAAEMLRQDLRTDEQPFREAVADLLDDMVADMRHEGVTSVPLRPGLYSALTRRRMDSWENALNVADAYLGSEAGAR